MDNCPSCGQPWPQKGKRACSLCRQPIRRSEKWEFGPDSRPRHKHCSGGELTDDERRRACAFNLPGLVFPGPKQHTPEE